MSNIKNEEKARLKVQISHTDLDIIVPVDEEQYYLEAAEVINQKIDAFAKVYASKKPLMEIILLVALEIVHASLKKQHTSKLNKFLKIINRKTVDKRNDNTGNLQQYRCAEH